MKVSIKQISQMTGFSPATVSNALNRKKGVNEETSRKIFKVAEELGYQTEKTITKIKFVTYRKNGRIIDDSLIFPAMIEGVERQAKELGYETAFSHLNYEDDAFQERLKEVLEDTNSLMILLGTEMMEEDYQPFMDYKGYMIVLDGWCEEMAFDGVLINNTDAACNAVEYLIENGHRRIGYLRGLPDQGFPVQGIWILPHAWKAWPGRGTGIRGHAGDDAGDGIRRHESLPGRSAGIADSVLRG
ncbi:MAG: LacI family DNA-binding transcriptional regulator [[Clostridium] scindens]